LSASGPEKSIRFADAETVRWTEWALQSGGDQSAKGALREHRNLPPRLEHAINDDEAGEGDDDPGELEEVDGDPDVALRILVKMTGWLFSWPEGCQSSVTT